MEQVSDLQTNQAIGAAAATSAGFSNSEIASEVARSLFSANFEQIITLQFHLQMGDVIGVLGLFFALDAWWSRRRKR